MTHSALQLSFLHTYLRVLIQIERDIIGGGAQSFAKMSFIAEVTVPTSWGLKMLGFLGTDDLLYSNNYFLTFIHDCN